MAYKSKARKGIYHFNENKFVKRFRKVYTEFSEYAGKPFKVLRVIKRGAESEDENGKVVWQPMYRIQFADGKKITAFGEEVCALV
jgi:hypothetical protein